MKYLIIGALSLPLVFFQNFTFVNWMDKKYFVDESSRVSHAREILGKKYYHSDVSKVEGDKHIHIHLFDLVQRGLPKKYKNQSKKIVTTIINESKKFEIDPIFIASIILTESSFNPEAKGTSGEIGLMQILPNTAKEVAYRHKIPWTNQRNLLNPVTNIKIGTAYISQLRNFFDNKPVRYISAYNVGPGRVSRIENKDNVPRFYKSKVLKNYEDLYRKMFASKVMSNLASQ